MEPGRRYFLTPEDDYLFIVFLLLACSVFLKSWFSTQGYISPDSASYLALAQNLLEGNGFYYFSAAQSGQERMFFSIWPVGYPVFIFLMAKISGLSVFWASKTVNVLIIGLILIVFRKLFKGSAYLYGLIFFFASYLELFAYTWSEAAFLLFLVLFCVSIKNALESKALSPFLVFALFSSSLCLFLSRYIGAFSFGIIGLLGLYFLLIKKDVPRAGVLIGISLINIFLMATYLYNNYIQTGFITGMQRVPATETNLELLQLFFSAILAEYIIPAQSLSKKGVSIFWLQSVVIVFFIYFYRFELKRLLKNITQKPVPTISVVFAIIGLFYFLFIAILRWRSQFDYFGFRLLAPGTFLCLVAVIALLEERGEKKLFTGLRNFILLFAVISFLLNVPAKIYKVHSQPTYSDTIQSVHAQYSNVKADSVVVFGSIHLQYLRTDLRISDPFIRPFYARKETWSEFMARIDPDKSQAIYMVIPHNKRKILYDESVIAVIDQYKKHSMVELP